MFFLEELIKKNFTKNVFLHLENISYKFFYYLKTQIYTIKLFMEKPQIEASTERAKIASYLLQKSLHKKPCLP